MTAAQRISIFKWSVSLIISVILFLFWKGCSNEGSGKKATDTLSVKADTIYIKSKSDTFYTPQLVKTEWRTSKPQYKTDTLESFKDVDTAAILKGYLATNYYEDSVPVQYGKIYINDTVTQNKIKSRGVRTQFNIPVVKETITLSAERRNIFYLSLGAMGSTESFLQQTSLGFGLKNKRDKYYGVEAAISREGYLLYGGKIMLPIRLRKQ